MGKNYENFYENMAECQYRLNGSVVMYDDEPCYILAIAPSKIDSIFRVYSLPITKAGKFLSGSIRDFYPQELPPGDPRQATYIDAFMETEEGKKLGILRKHINSPKFNRFRPFALGMLNLNGKTYYLERAPQRSRDQGLTHGSVHQTVINLSPAEVRATTRMSFQPVGEEMRACIKGEHPSLKECLETMRDPAVTNDAVAFHRNCALIKAPLDIFFLAVKTDIVGLVTEDRTATLAPRFKYLKETVENTNAFERVTVK